MVGPRFRKELRELRDDVDVKVTVPAVSRAVAPRSARPVMPAVRGGSAVWQLVSNSSAPPAVTIYDELQSLDGWASYPPNPHEGGPIPSHCADPLCTAGGGEPLEAFWCGRFWPGGGPGLG